MQSSKVLVDRRAKLSLPRILGKKARGFRSFHLLLSHFCASNSRDKFIPLHRLKMTNCIAHKE